MRKYASLIASVSLAAASTSIYAQSSFVSHSSGSTTASLTSSVPSAKPSGKSKDEVKEVVPVKIKASVTDGYLTVDGMVAKVRLNYAVNNSYIYFFIPDVGAVVVAQENFPGAVKQDNAFTNKTLTVDAEGHQVQLSSSVNLATKKGADAYVYVDHSFRTTTNFPMMGYGDTRNSPYVWPGSRAADPVERRSVVASTVKAPAIPKPFLPKMEVASSYSVVVKPSGQ